MGSLTQQNHLPVIDLTKNNVDDPNSTSWSATRSEVVRALEEYGCFEAIFDDKIPLDLHESIFRAAEQLFDLPTEAKVLNTSDAPTHGYVGQEPVIPLYEGLGIEDSTTLEGVERFTRLLWPNGNPYFSETALSFARALAGLDQLVMRMVSETYGVEKEYQSLVGSMSYLLRFIKYRGPQENEKTLGILPHTDKSFMSILHQRQVKGLEIKLGEEWTLIHPSPSSFIVMAGDACMAWTNGRIEPPYHRVTMMGKEERYSMGLFTFIRDMIIEIPETLADEEHPMQYKPFDHYKFNEYYVYTEEGKKSKCAIKSYCGI